MPKIISRKEAKARGLKRYFTGKSCRRGHLCERDIHARCIICHRSYAAKWRAENPEYQKAWYSKNREWAIKYAKEWYTKNREHALELAKLRLKENPEKYSKRQMLFKAKRTLAIQIIGELARRDKHLQKIMDEINDLIK